MDSLNCECGRPCESVEHLLLKSVTCTGERNVLRQRLAGLEGRPISPLKILGSWQAVHLQRRVQLLYTTFYNNGHFIPLFDFRVPTFSQSQLKSDHKSTLSYTISIIGAASDFRLSHRTSPTTAELQAMFEAITYITKTVVPCKWVILSD